MPQAKLMILAASMLLSACVVAPYPRYGGYYGGGPVGSVVVTADIAPPAPYAEVVPAMPYAGAVWLGGYWGWGGGRHQWVPGRWDAHRPGYAWRPYAWAPHGGRWQLNAGGWVAH